MEKVSSNVPAVLTGLVVLIFSYFAAVEMSGISQWQWAISMTYYAIGAVAYRACVRRHEFELMLLSSSAKRDELHSKVTSMRAEIDTLKSENFSLLSENRDLRSNVLHGRK